MACGSGLCTMVAAFVLEPSACTEALDFALDASVGVCFLGPGACAEAPYCERDESGRVFAAAVQTNSRMSFVIALQVLAPRRYASGALVSEA